MTDDSQEVDVVWLYHSSFFLAGLAYGEKSRWFCDSDWWRNVHASAFVGAPVKRGLLLKRPPPPPPPRFPPPFPPPY